MTFKFVLEFIGVSITSVWYLVDLYRVILCTCSIAFRCNQRGQTTLGRFGLKKAFRTEIAQNLKISASALILKFKILIMLFTTVQDNKLINNKKIYK